jgi:hypothetical protein
MTVQLIGPNPYSPFATADMDRWHLLPEPVLVPVPKPGELASTGCYRLAVVPISDVSDVDSAGRIPVGVCEVCWQVEQSGGVWVPPRLEAMTCGTCTMPSWQGATCAICRIKAHRAWWAQKAGAR